MPQNDLVAFQLLSIPATPTSQAFPDPGSPAHGTGLTSKTLSTWTDAVNHLWLTPIPRVIVVAGGGTGFEVVGGKNIHLTPRAPNDDTRWEVYRTTEDENTVPVPVGASWQEASPTNGYQTAPFDAVILSATEGCNVPGRHEMFRCLMPNGNAWSCTPKRACGAILGSDLDAFPTNATATWRLRIADGSAETARIERVPAGGITAIPSTGRVTLTSIGAPTPVSWDVYRLSGDTVLSGGNLLDAMAYGWVVRDTASNQWLWGSANPSEMGTMSYVGCYRDNAADRAMPLVLNLPDSRRHAVACSEEAASRGRRFFSLQAGGECRIGTTLAAATKHGTASAGPTDACGSLRNGMLPAGKAVGMAVYENRQAYVDTQAPPPPGCPDPVR